MRNAITHLQIMLWDILSFLLRVCDFFYSLTIQDASKSKGSSFPIVIVIAIVVPIGIIIILLVVLILVVSRRKGKQTGRRDTDSITELANMMEGPRQHAENSPNIEEKIEIIKVLGRGRIL